MKEKVNQMFKDKLFLVMLVLGLLTIVAAAGVVTMQRGNGQEQNPYMDMQGQDEFLAQETAPEANLAGESNAEPAAPEKTEEKLADHAKTEDVTTGESQVAAAGTDDGAGSTAGNTVDSGEAQPAGSGMDAAKALVLNFSDASSMLWPVRGNIVLDYNMESTIYFPTLDQYKCNPGLVIQSAVSEPVYAPANARVLESGFNEEIGNYLKLDLGNDYTAVCGQLKEVAAVEGEYLEQGQLMGYVAEPTKYYSVEGSNLFLEVMHKDKTVDPLDYLE